MDDKATDPSNVDLHLKTDTDAGGLGDLRLQLWALPQRCWGKEKPESEKLPAALSVLGQENKVKRRIKNSYHAVKGCMP